MRFQSSPFPKEGRYTAAITTLDGTARFNPRPSRRKGATCQRSEPTRSHDVSILALPEGRALLSRLPPRQQPVEVSILALPEGRALRWVLRPLPRGTMCFNPRPSRRKGATSGSAAMPAPSGGFNPRPSRRKGATPGSTFNRCIKTGFNPRPSRRKGATSGGAKLCREIVEFQSSPFPKEGRYIRRGETLPGDSRVSILALPEGRALRRAGSRGRRTRPVSILALPEGRALRVIQASTRTSA
ncbi:MAG: hypothetical protein OJF47_004077 [Nitrospira sp.]|nr:MAG: hypothetical protein OJF47_004077 [Nitrospira sp.]